MALTNSVRIRGFASCLALVIVTTHGVVHGAGFAIDFIGARSLGTATAGSASAKDAATIFFNPAGIVDLQRNEWLVGGDRFRLYDRFQDQGSTILGGGLPTPGSNGQDAIPGAFIPWAFGAYRISPTFSIGLGIFAPFGLQTDYGSDFVGRYQNILTALRVVDVNPVIAWRPLEWLSVGGGLNFEYASIHLTQAIDFGSACVGAIGTAACGGLGLTPGRSDGYTSLKGNNIALGFNLGMLIRPWPKSQFGISYRSSVRHRFEDASQTFVVPAGARAFLTAGGTPTALTNGTASTHLPLPSRLFLGWSETLGSMTVLADATHTKWSIFQTTIVTPANPVTGAAAIIPQNYKSAWRYSLGAEYQLSKRWALRGGVAYDQTPITAAAVQAALPDRNRVYYSTGFSYGESDSWSFDVGYSYVNYLGKIAINRSTSSGDTLRGEFSVGGHIFAAQIKYRF